MGKMKASTSWGCDEGSGNKNHGAHSSWHLLHTEINQVIDLSSSLPQWGTDHVSLVHSCFLRAWAFEWMNVCSFLHLLLTLSLYSWLAQLCFSFQFKFIKHWQAGWAFSQMLLLSHARPPAYNYLLSPLQDIYFPGIMPLWRLFHNLGISKRSRECSNWKRHRGKSSSPSGDTDGRAKSKSNNREQVGRVPSWEPGGLDWHPCLTGNHWTILGRSLHCPDPSCLYL